MAAEGHVIECSCGRLHQVTADQAGETLECDCGKELEVDIPASLPDADDGGDEGESSGGKGSGGKSRKKNKKKGSGGGEGDSDDDGGSIAGSVRRHWKVLSASAALIAIALAAISFWYGPGSIFGGGDGSGRSGSNSSSQVEKEDPAVHLHALEDNSRWEEHDNAAAVLLRLNDPTIVPRLCHMAGQKELASRPLVIRLLGKKGDESAVEVLGPMLGNSDPTIVYASAEALARINTSLSESVLRKVLQDPARGNTLLPSIAAVKSDLSHSILASALSNPALRSKAMDEIGTQRVSGCVTVLVKLARDRTAPDVDRIRSVETLAKIGTPEARRALLQLTEDDYVSWKARQLLGGQSRR